MNSSEQYSVFLDDIDAYVVTLRSLMIDRMERQPDNWRVGLLTPDWRQVRRWYDVLWAFDIEGIRCSGFPNLLDTHQRPHCTPETYSSYWTELEADAVNAMRTTAPVDRDPRFIAFRCSYDWAVLNARGLVGGCAENLNDAISSHADVFTRLLVDPGEGDDYEPMLMAGPPEHLLHRSRGSDEHSMDPDWSRVQDRYSVLCAFRWSGRNSNRQLPSERPASSNVEAFLAALSRLASDAQTVWLEFWPLTDEAAIKADPRYVAFTCGYDRQSANQAMKMLNRRMTPRDEDLI